MELSQQSYSSEEEKWKNTYFSLAFVDISPDDVMWEKRAGRLIIWSEMFVWMAMMNNVQGLHIPQKRKCDQVDLLSIYFRS